MRLLLLVVLSLSLPSPALAQPNTQPVDRPKVAIAIHGGAGTISRDAMTPEREAAYRRALADALRIGEQVLLDGGSALDAVEATIMRMENDPLFNAGKGSVLTAEGRCELDASIMDGATTEAGAVASVTTVKNPIKAARAVMEQTPHALLVGDGAEKFAEEAGLERVDNDYFVTDRRREALRRVQERERGEPQGRIDDFDDHKFGTVGCVALDADGNLAAGTSTGGLTNKRFGRVGDSPIIGAGTWADGNVGISCTGQG